MVGIETPHDALDDFRVRGGRLGCGCNPCAAETVPFDRAVGRCHAVIAGTPCDGRRAYTPGSGLRGSIAGLSTGNEAIKNIPYGRKMIFAAAVDPASILANAPAPSFSDRSSNHCNLPNWPAASAATVCRKSRGV